jgi:hypothetical protein
MGNISCPTCHNVHQWDPISKDKGKGVNVEGDMSNSFLRPQASRVLCADCHPRDAALKFKNYHDTTTRKFKGIDELFF